MVFGFNLELIELEIGILFYQNLLVVIMALLVLNLTDYVFLIEAAIHILIVFWLLTWLIQLIRFIFKLVTVNFILEIIWIRLFD